MDDTATLWIEDGQWWCRHTAGAWGYPRTEKVKRITNPWGGRWRRGILLTDEVTALAAMRAFPVLREFSSIFTSRIFCHMRVASLQELNYEYWTDPYDIEGFRLKESNRDKTAWWFSFKWECLDVERPLPLDVML